MKFLTLLTLLASLGLAQSSHAWNCFPEVSLTDDLYWNHQPLVVQALRNASPADRETKGTALAVQGFTIDVPIMVWGLDPVCVMGIRAQEGYTWVPSALQPAVPLGPGISFPGLPSYDAANPPVGSIKVSTDAKDYPPANPPPAPPPTAANKVGVCYNGGPLGTVCALGPGASVSTLHDGDKITEGGFSYLAHVSQGLFGVTAFWTRS